MATKVRNLTEYFKQFSIVLLVETFIEQKNATTMEKLLPTNYQWFWSYANRDKAKGRPWGGQLIGVAQDIRASDPWDDRRKCCSGIDVTIEGVIYNITNVYNREGVKNIKSLLSKVWEENLNKKCIVLGDWNARIGENDQPTLCAAFSRTSKDKTRNSEGEEMLELFEDYGLKILNGCKDGDWEGQVTHVGYRSQSVIDYGATNEDAWPHITSFQVGDRSESDHFPIEVTLNATFTESIQHEEMRWIPTLAKENCKEYQLKLQEASGEFNTWNEIAEVIRRVTPKKLWKPRKADPHWWNLECYVARLQKEESLKKARVSGEYEDYHESRKSYKKLIKEQKRIHNQRIIDELAQITSVGEAWKFINARKTKGAESVALPSEAELAEHFKTLLMGHHERSEEPHVYPECLTSELITHEAFDAYLAKMKSKKAAGVDEIKAEALMYADQGTKRKLLSIINGCLQGDPVPDEWRDVRIFPLHKKGDPRLAKNYRGISLVNSVYKLYANIITDKLQKFIEDNKCLPDCQNGFRKGRSTIDNIYILNTCIQSAICEKSQLFAVFVDYKAAFDRVNREKLFVKLAKLNVPDFLTEAIRELYRETRYTIGSTTFWTRNGLRQGCPLSPLLFAIYISDLEMVMNNWQSGGTRVGSCSIRCLAYADDIVLIAKTPGELKDMISCLERYSRRRDMIISTEKTKVMKFSAGGRRSSQKWFCNGEVLEEVTSFNYLGFVFQSSGSHKNHLKLLAARGKSQVATVWSLGERMFPQNFTIRKQMYYSLVESATSYGCEIFGFAEREELERIQRMYFRWTLGVAPWTRVSAIYRETGTMPVHQRFVKRALRYQEKARESPCLALRACVEEMDRGLTSTARERTHLLNKLGFSKDYVNHLRERGTDVVATLVNRLNDQFLQCAENTGEVNPLALPGYLVRGTEYKLVARFRLGNETRGDQMWRKDRSCRVCHEVAETLDHVLDCYGGAKEDILHESGSGLATIKRILQWRKEAEA